MPKAERYPDRAVGRYITFIDFTPSAGQPFVLNSFGHASGVGSMTSQFHSMSFFQFVQQSGLSSKGKSGKSFERSLRIALTLIAVADSDESR